MSESKKIRPAKRSGGMEIETEIETETESGDIYRFYMEELAQISPCTEEENGKLLEKAARGDLHAKKRLVEGNLKAALFLVQDYINQGVPMADLIQEASIELTVLADEYRPGDGPFEGELERRVRRRLSEYLKEQQEEADLEEEILARVNVLQEVSRRMAEELGREATVAELAGRMKMTEDEIREIMKITMDALNAAGPAADEEPEL